MQAKSWKTTTAGLLGAGLVIGKVAYDYLNGHPPDIAALLGAFAALATSFGLIKAKDSDVTGGTR